ncbi:MAG: alkaline phosphatase [Acidimicrobiia bacterium]
MQPVSRRSFLALTAAVVVAGCSPSEPTSTPASGTLDESPPDETGATVPTVTAAPSNTAPTTTQPPGDPPTAEYEGSTDPFALGIASGDPLTDSVVLWTRLIAGEGEQLSGERSVAVVWAAEDDESAGGAIWIRTDESSAYAVRAIIDGLDADRWYTYHFRSGGFTSPTGRTRTTPASDATVEQFLVGSASCQNYEDGFYAAHDDIATAGLDLLVWLGDYIYEGGPGTLGEDGTVRLHDAPEPTTLDEYRARYALYKRDASLQAAHRACPWFVTWDDHEVDNNYAGKAGQGGEDLTERRAIAYRAWWEHTPTRLPGPDTSDYTIYRAQRWGTLVDMSLLDTRQYRSDQACNDVTLSVDPPCPETFTPERTMLGSAQEAWLFDRFGRQGVVWNVLAQQVIMTDSTLDGAVLNYDQWDGYPADRDRVLQHVVDEDISNLIVLTGDIHFAGIGNLLAPAAPAAPAEGDAPAAAVVPRATIGAEFVATSISSGGLVPESVTPVILSIPTIVDVELVHRGWVKHTVTPDSWTADYRIVEDPTDPASASSTYRRFVVDAGTPGARPLDP